MTGIEAFLEILAGAEVRHLFGNPGTTELPLNDALARDPRFHYAFGRGLEDVLVLDRQDIVVADLAQRVDECRPELPSMRSSDGPEDPRPLRRDGEAAVGGRVG